MGAHLHHQGGGGCVGHSGGVWRGGGGLGQAGRTFANFQATSAAAGVQGVEESKSNDSKFDQLLAAMATQAAQTEQGLAQMRETQAQVHQAQTELMQMMGMIFAGQEQQRLTNEWVTSSITSISASSGCAIEAAPEPQAVITMPPALVRFAGVASDPDAMMTETASAAAATGSPALAVSARAVHETHRRWMHPSGG